MPEWTVTIESPANTTSDPDALILFQDALMNDGRTLGPSASLQRDTGRIGVILQVNADVRDEAAFKACLIYWDALSNAGIRLTNLSRVDVRPEGDDGDTQRFNAGVVLERSAA